MSDDNDPGVISEMVTRLAVAYNRGSSFPNAHAQTFVEVGLVRVLFAMTIDDAVRVMVEATKKDAP